MSKRKNKSGDKPSPSEMVGLVTALLGLIKIILELIKEISD